MKKIYYILLFLILLSQVSIAQNQQFRSGILLRQFIGDKIWGPNGSTTSVPQEIINYNTSNSFTGSFQVTLKDTLWPQDQMNNEWFRWHLIFNNQIQPADISPILLNNKIVIVKTSYTSSDMEGWGVPSDTTVPSKKTVFNDKWHWRNIVRVMRNHPEIYFIIWTNAPLVSSSDSAALFSHYFCKWAKDSLATGKDSLTGKFPLNVYVFDYFHKLTDQNSKWKLKSEYALNFTESYPSAAATQLVAPQFVNEVFDNSVDYEKYYNGVVPVPVLLKPDNGALNIPISEIFKWTKVYNAVKYRIQVAKDTAYTAMVLENTNVTDTAISYNTLDYGSKFYWRVKAINYASESNWTSSRSFTTTIAPPGVPTLVAPNDKDEGKDVNCYFNWTAPIPNGDRYRIQVASDSTFVTIVRDSTIMGQTFIYIRLDSNGTYYWRVKAINAGGEGGWSLIRTFKTMMSTPDTPDLVAPTQSELDVVLQPTFIWNDVPRAAIYEFVLASDQYLTQKVLDTLGLTSSTFTYTTDLLQNTQYWWKVRGKNVTGFGNWSPVRTFTTSPAKPDVVQLTYPANNGTNVAILPTFRWQAAPRAFNYHIQVSVDSAYSQLLVDNNQLPDTLYSMSNELERKRDYYWHVKALNAGGESDWSESRMFTTIPNPPLAPVLITPFDKDSNSTRKPVFIWGKVATADKYHIVLAKDYQFFIIVASDTEVVDSTYTYPDTLEAFTKYYWHARAANGGGTSAWSPSRYFITSDITPVIETENYFNVLNNSPNPFENTTNIQFSVSKRENVTLEIFDMLGIRISNLLNEELNPGSYSVEFDVSKISAKLSNDAMLIGKLKVGNEIYIRKLMLIR